jgi:two-component system sensor histidine kinase CreC
LRLLIEDMAQRLQASGAPRNVSVSVTPSSEQATVVGDAFLLKRALSNLIDNAMDFSPEGGVVTLRLSTQGRRATVTVRDHGPGIPDYARGKVFEKFYSLARPHSQKRSTGLGLSFVKEIVTLHHGEVTLNNAPAGGALATFWLPIHRAKH